VSAGRNPVADALEEAARVGPFFAVALAPAEPGWTSFRAFASDREQVRSAVEHVRSSLAVRAGAPEPTIERRVAASVWHLGLVSRLVSPALGAASLTGWVPDLAALLWRGSGGQPVPLGIATPSGVHARDADAAAAALLDLAVRPVVGPLTDTTAAVAAVSERVLWGNVWSALAGAATVLARTPDGSDVGRHIAAAAAATSGQALTGRYDARLGYRRETCCLYYRVPHTGLCGDCVLAPMA
jgi:hypothetical protein